MSDRTNTRKQDRIKELVGNFNSFESRRDHILFNYQFLTSGEEYGQSFEDWDRERIILDLNNKLKVFSGLADGGEFVACVGCGHHACVQVQDAKPGCYKKPRLVSFAKLVVGVGQNLRGRRNRSRKRAVLYDCL